MDSIEELIESRTRAELDEMAYELGLRTSDQSKFPNKADVVQAILMRESDPFIRWIAF